MEDQFDVVVVGAGLAGLTAGARSAQAGRRVAVLDGRPPGGRAATDTKGAYKLNQGAHAVYREGAGRRVLAMLGITPRGAPPLTKGAMGWRDGELGLLPAGPASLARSPLLTPRAKVQLANELGRMQRHDAPAHAHESAAEWLDSLELRPDAAAMIEALIHVSSYAGDLRELSADAAIGQLQMALKGGVDYLDGGWQQLVDALVAALERVGGVLRTGEPVLGVEPAGDRWRVRVGDRALDAAAVVVANGGPDAARALLPVDPGWSGLGPDLTAACLDLGINRLPSPRVVFGIGEPLYFSTHSPPADLAPPGHAVVQLMRYGARTSDEDRAQLWALAAAAGIGEGDVVEHRFLHRMVVAHAQPAPGRGLAGRPPVTVAPGLYVAGDWVGPTGMLADASYASADAAARAAIAHTAEVGAAA